MMFKKRYRQYQVGGDMTQVLAMLGNTADAINPGNQYGRQSTATNMIKGISSGASLGTAIAPGIGTAIGTGVGAVAGYLNDRKARKAEKEMIFREQLAKQQQELNRSSAIIGNNPALVTGQPGVEFYASGGFLKGIYDNIKTSGGKLKTMSTGSAEVQGPSHENGGVDLPQYSSEVEGGETIQNDYVFSKRLGFANIHKKLAKNIGKIEMKPATPDRLNALKSMNQQIQKLQQLQEQIRQQHNLQ